MTDNSHQNDSGMGKSQAVSWDSVEIRTFTLGKPCSMDMAQHYDLGYPGNSKWVILQISNVQNVGARGRFSSSHLTFVQTHCGNTPCLLAL